MPLMLIYIFGNIVHTCFIHTLLLSFDME